MGNIAGASFGLFALMLVLVVFANIFQVQLIDAKLDVVDSFLVKKVSVHRGFTSAVDTELEAVLQGLNLNRSDFDFSGTTTAQVEWGQTAHISYEFENNFIQKGLEFIGVPNLTIPPRSYDVVVTGR